MAIPKKILNYLDKEKIKYEVVEHKKVYTALDAAQTQKIRPQEVAKTLVMKADKNYVLVLLPANKNLNKAKFKKLVKAKKIDFAKEVWMKKNLPGKVGSTPPFGKLLKMNLFMDGALFKPKYIYLQSGEYTQSIKMSPKQFSKLEQPIKGSFSQAKK